MKYNLNESFESLANKYLKEYRQMAGDPFWMVAKYAGRTKDGVAFNKGDDILWFPRTKTAMIGAKAEQAWGEFQGQAEDEDTYAGGYGSMNEGMSGGRKLVKDTKLKNGDVIPSGTPVAVEFYADSDDKKGERICKLHIKFTGESGRNYEDEPMQVYISNLPKTVSGFKEPSIKTMEKWMSDAIALTPTGKRVEPDGYGPDGSPSWLLALGLI